MLTRFDNKYAWRKDKNDERDLEDMETSYLLNVVRLCILNPTKVQSMIVEDLENARVWTYRGPGADQRAASIHNATSMTNEEVTEYFLNSPLFRGISDELESRGVNVRQMISNIEEEGM